MEIGIIEIGQESLEELGRILEILGKPGRDSEISRITKDDQTFAREIMLHGFPRVSMGILGSKDNVESKKGWFLHQSVIFKKLRFRDSYKKALCKNIVQLI